MAAAMGALVGTAAWAITLNRYTIDIRVPVILAGIICAASTSIVPIRQELAGLWGIQACLGALLCAYQYCLYIAFTDDGAAIQAVINCNVVLICAYQWLVGALDCSLIGVALVVSTCASSAGLVLFLAQSPTVNESEHVRSTTLE